MAGQKFLRDDRLTGLAVRITAGGVKSFIFEGRVHGRVRRITIGQYPSVTVALARKETLRIRSEIAQGRDPVTDRAAEHEVVTFGDLEELYIERYAKPHKRTWKRDEQMIAGYLSRWRNRRLSEITADDVARLHERLGGENGRYAANRTVALLRTMFNLAHDWGYLKTDNPAYRRPRQEGRISCRFPKRQWKFWRGYQEPRNLYSQEKVPADTWPNQPRRGSASEKGQVCQMPECTICVAHWVAGSLHRVTVCLSSVEL